VSDTILNGRWTVYYLSENRQRRIKWTGGTASPDTVKSLYLALMDLFDELNQMDEGVPLSAQTPTEYTIGIIDPGDKDPWFIDRESVEHLKGGALKTASWKRVTGSNTGIVKVVCNNTNIVEGDIGYTITHSNGDSGTLLDVKGTGAGSELWIRPADATSANDWKHTSGTITCNGHTATQTAEAVTGEMLWANIYGLGTLATDTHLYVYQGAQTDDTAPDHIVTGYKSNWNWWTDGFFDILILVADQASSLTDRQYFIDQGYVSVFARRYGATYTYYIVDLFTGGRNPIPLETADDLSNPTGYRTVTLSSSSGTWNVGDEINGGTSGARGKITATSGSNPTITLRYYLIGNVTIDFQNGETITDVDSGASGTSGTPANYGPATYTGLSITHGANNTHDIDENGTNEYYSIVINCNSYSLAEVYEWLKYITRDGATGTGNTDGIEGEQYIGSDYRLVYNTLTGSIPEGSVVTQDNTGAKGTVVAHHTTPKILVLRNCRGTFNTTDPVRKDGSNYVTMTSGSAVVITPTKACPYGTFPGQAIFFAAAGVVLDNYQSSEVNKFRLTDDQGNAVAAPTKVTVSVTNTRVKDRIAVFRLSGGNIEKTYYTIDTAVSIGDTTISVDPAIRVDEPGKTSGGVLFVVDNTNKREDRYRYTGYSGDDFTLFNKPQDTAESGTTSTKIVATGGFTNCKVGDIIRNITRSAVTYISEIVSDNEVNVYPAVSGQTSGDSFRVGAAAYAYTTSDNVYVPIIHVHETEGTDASPGSESVLMVYSSDVSARVRARHANDTQYNIKPFETDVTIGSSGASVAVIRTPETITS